MTQEELDALMNGDIDLDEGYEEEESFPSDSEDTKGISTDEPEQPGYRVSALHSWPPPPPTDDNKMVHQLDDVTKESEQKASEIFDLIEEISNDLSDGEKQVKTIHGVVQTNIELFQTLCTKFPHVEAFQT
ncbi:MAG: chemotaxis protein, partial [Campylobacterales bacterium]|nr:chemotaxis protein [Campylobacterales bacterium]